MRATMEELEFALRWRHWGGGDDEDIFIQFGLHPHQYFLRVRKLLSTSAAETLSFDEKDHNRRICQARLAQPQRAPRRTLH